MINVFTELANTKYNFKNMPLPLRKVLYLHTFAHMQVSIETLIYDDVPYREMFVIFLVFFFARFLFFAFVYSSCVSTARLDEIYPLG